MAKKKKISWFGMKLSPEEKARIDRLADIEGLNRKDAILNAVEDRLHAYGTKPVEGSLFEKMAAWAGVMEGEKTLSSDREHLSGYGSNRLP
jgi:hypothetical protein